MKNVAILAYIAAAAAQATYNSTTGKYNCAIPGGAYCADPSLGSPIIIRCINGIGSPGNCDDNLDGDPPFGDNPTSCWQTSATSGDAACEKNCVVYGGSGNYNGTFTLPADECTPYYTSSSSSSVVSSTSTSSSAASSSTTCSVGPSTVTTTVTTSTTICPTSSGTGVSISTSSAPSNGTTTTASGSVSVATSATNTPVPPTTTTGVVTVPTAGAAVNSVGGAIALLGLAAAYLL